MRTLNCLILCCALTMNLLSQQLSEKVLICGVCRNIAHAVANTIKNIEELGSHFDDYRAVIYENNSSDDTSRLLTAWAQQNNKAIFISEILTQEQLPGSRTEKIARARNIVLSVAKDLQFKDYKYLIMADLDFTTPWPIQEILETIQSPLEWDCVSANGVVGPTTYFDRYAYRDRTFPFGPEVLGDFFWSDLQQTWFDIDKNQKEWTPVFSAFGGLAIYKTASLLQFDYSGTVTPDLYKYYMQIQTSISPFNPYERKIWKRNLGSRTKNKPILFCSNTFGEHPKDYKLVTCCEHVPLHASMALHGFGRFYINPKMCMHYTN